MNRFTYTVQQDTPRLVIEFFLKDGNETFKWSVVGHIPILSLIGAMTRIQTDGHIRSGNEDEDTGAPSHALVAVWQADANDFEVFIGSEIPMYSLVGMLEIIKTSLVAAFMARAMATMTPPIYGPDGQPMIRRQ